ncbi:MAG: hypothetical protein HQ567_00905 [Candidatus Nealsonbacteria bacterium]|nr:hypothetical protein [Candidatus Nealsonbacteria bacterium]
MRRLFVCTFAVVLIAGSDNVFGQFIQPLDQPFQPETVPAVPTPADPGYITPPIDPLAPGGLLDPDTPDWLLPGGAPPTARDIALRQRELALEQMSLLQPSVTVGGRIAVDAAAFSQSTDNLQEYGNIENGCGITRARIHVRGEAFHVIDYKLEMGFDNWASVIDDFQTPGAQTQFLQRRVQSTAFKDAYVGINELPWLGHVKIGRFKEPFGLSKMTSSRFTTFMERSPVSVAFAPGRGLGIMASDWSDSERFTWAAGVFRSVIDPDPPIRSGDNGGIAATMRLTALPWYDEATEGRGLFHLGLGYSYRDPDDGAAGFSSPPESLLAFRARDPGLGAIGIAGMELTHIVDTGSIGDVTNWQLLGLETAWVYGPLSVQAEYMAASVRRAAGVAQPHTFNGGYIQMSYFLTGEHRPYHRTEGKFTRVVPFENFFRVRTEGGDVVTGKGAWELAYRFSAVDLDFYDVTEEDAVDRFKGGRSVNHTFGVNWYLNPYTRLMANCVLINATPKGDVDYSDLQVFQVRAQIDF